MKKRWSTSISAMYNIGFHLIWCPKYRKRILVGAIEKRLKELLVEKAKKIGIQIDTMEVMPDHVHLFVKSRPTQTPSYIVQQLKGYTARALRKEFKDLFKALPSLWTRSYYCESVGHISEKTVKRSILDQKKQ